MAGARKSMTSPVSGADVARRLAVGELGWDDLVVAADVVDALRSLAGVAAGGGLVAVVDGPPGVGKTFAVQAWAESMRLDLWRVDCRRLVERHGVGVAGRGLDEALAYGVRPHAILLFHDADTLPVTAVEALVGRALGRRAPTVLEARMPAADALVAGLPVEVHRIRLQLPDRALRRRHWELAVGRASPLSRPDLDALAALEVPGATIEAAVRAVVLAKGDERVETVDLVAAARELTVESTRPHGG